MPDIRSSEPGMPERLGGYRVRRLIGEGGHGSVYLGETPKGQRVAIKVLRSRLDDGAAAAAQFLHEVSATRKVASFCTARVIDVGIEGGTPYIVSEYVKGPSLQRLVERDGPGSVDAVVRLAVGTLSALVAIHNARVVHCDFKPSNVLLGPDGPRVIDFGIAQALGSTRTVSGEIMGTPAYMAPEQINGHPAAPASDMFSWACTMVCAATGEPPFGRDSRTAVIRRVLYREPDLSNVPGQLRPLLERCLRKVPEERPTAAELLFSLLGTSDPGVGARDAAPKPAERSGERPTGEQRAGERSGERTEMGPSPRTGDGTSAERTSAGGRARPATGTGPTEPSRPGFTAGGGLRRLRRMGRLPLLGAAAALVTVLGGSVLLVQHLTGGSPPEPRPWAEPLAGPLRGHTAAVETIAIGEVGARPVVLTGSADGTLRLWGLDGAPAGGPLTGHEGPVKAVAAAEWDGRPVAVTGGDDATVRIWDLAGGRSDGDPLTGHGRSIEQVATTVVDGRPVAVTAAADGTVRLWDVDKGEGIGDAFHGHSGPIWSVSTGTLGGSPVAVTAGDDRTVRIWDLTSGDPAGGPLTGHESAVWSVATAVVDGRSIAVSAGLDGTVRTWDLDAGAQRGRLPVELEGQPQVRTGTHGGRPIAVTGDGRGQVRVWDLATAKPAGPPLQGHRAAIRSLEVGEVDGATVVVAGAEDGTTRVWRLRG